MQIIAARFKTYSVEKQGSLSFALQSLAIALVPLLLSAEITIAIVEFGASHSEQVFYLND